MIHLIVYPTMNILQQLIGYSYVNEQLVLYGPLAVTTVGNATPVAQKRCILTVFYADSSGIYTDVM